MPLVGPTLRRREEYNLAAIKAALGWCGSDTMNPASLYSGMIRVAKLAHRCYRTLALTYDAHGYNARVDRITRRELNRAANAVADQAVSLVGARVCEFIG